MSESWFYRESPEHPERGPVSKSDLEYLQSSGRISAGMEVRSQFGTWTKIGAGTGKKRSRPVRSSGSSSSLPAAAARPRVRKAEPVAIEESVVTGSAPPVPVIKDADESDHTRRYIAAGISGGIALLLLLVFFLWPESNHSGIDNGNQAQSGDSPGDEAELGAPAPAESITATDKGGDSATSEADAATAANEQKDSGTSGSETGSAASPSGSEQKVADSGQSQASGAGGGDPAPLDRNVKQSHIISPGAEFFGLRANGSKFVFLIDSSGSMAGGRDAAAKRELIKTLKKMAPDMQVEVIFFTDSPTHVFGGYKSLRKRREVIRKLETLNPFVGGTPVMPSLTNALQMAPDAIFLLTDGEFSEGDISSRMRSMNPNRIPVNTVALVNRTAESVLKKVAKVTGGDYRYVAR